MILGVPGGQLQILATYWLFPFRHKADSPVDSLEEVRIQRGLQQTVPVFVLTEGHIHPTRVCPTNHLILVQAPFGSLWQLLCLWG